MTNPIIQTDIADILKEIKSDQKEILKEVGSVKEKVNHLEVSLEAVKGEIKAVDEKLSGQIKTLDTKVEQLDKRISNSEFTNRGILIGIVVIILGGVAKFFGLVGNS